MRLSELAEIYAEVEDFLKDELKEFLQYLLDSHCLDEGMAYVDWTKLINEYLDKEEGETKPQEVNLNG